MTRTSRAKAASISSRTKSCGVVEATAAVRIGDGQPVLADQRQQHVAGPDRAGDHLNEVVAQLDRVDVLEDLPAAVVVGEPVVEPAGLLGGLIAPVADEDPTRLGWRGCSHDPSSSLRGGAAALDDTDRTVEQTAGKRSLQPGERDKANYGCSSSVHAGDECCRR